MLGKVIGVASVLSLATGFILAVGVGGSVELNSIPLDEAFSLFIAGLSLMGLGFIGLHGFSADDWDEDFEYYED